MSSSATCATMRHDHIGKMSIVVALALGRSILKKKGTSSMQYILSLLPLLACPVGMGLMMWFMMRGNKQQTPDEVDQARMQTYKQPRAKASPPTMAEAPRRASTFN